MCLAECLVHIQKIPEVGYLQRHKTLRKERNASVDRKRSAKQIPEKTCIALTWCNFSAWNRFNNKIDWNWLNCDVFFWHLYILYIYIYNHATTVQPTFQHRLRAENRKFTNRLCGLQLEVESRSNAFDTFSWVTEAGSLVITCPEGFLQIHWWCSPQNMRSKFGVWNFWWRLLLWLFILYKWKKQTVSHLPAPGRPLIQKVHGFAVP